MGWIMNRKKKTVVYMIGLAVLVYCCVQITYMKDVYSPLQVLADAHSEAKRLLRFITLYHFLCNNTVRLSNTTSWPICVESDGGINFDINLPKIIYSIGPADYAFEESISKNSSCNIYIFSHEKPPKDFFITKNNNTHFIRTAIVPNDPADFSRNSYETQTLNNVLAIMKHKTVDILKIEHVLDMSRSYDLLYFLVKDHVLHSINQLHFSVLIDKINDDYLYAWYRTLYSLFHQANFRLYHTATSNQLCLQVTMMESCIYHMSWIRSPSPRMFIMYPPANDGTYKNELKRLEDYLDSKKVPCKEINNAKISDQMMPLELCLDVTKLGSPKNCKIVIIRDKRSPISVSHNSGLHCDVIVIQGSDLGDDGEVTVFNTNNQGNYVTNVQTIPLIQAMATYFTGETYNFLYADTGTEFWELISVMLDNAVLNGVDQMIADVELWDRIHQGNIRHHYSELRRLEAYKLYLHQYLNMQESERLYFSSFKKRKQRISFVRTKTSF